MDRCDFLNMGYVLKRCHLFNRSDLSNVRYCLNKSRVSTRVFFHGYHLFDRSFRNTGHFVHSGHSFSRGSCCEQGIFLREVMF